MKTELDNEFADIHRDEVKSPSPLQVVKACLIVYFAAIVSTLAIFYFIYGGL